MRGDTEPIHLNLRAQAWRRWGPYLCLLGILALAAGLRLWRLDGPPLWFDEGNNLYFAHSSLPRLVEMARLTHDTDPPAHRLLLGLWLRWVGDSAFSARLFSVVYGLLTAALLFVWGRWLLDVRTGLLAAALWALAPMAIYYTREAKGYALVALFGSLATYLWARYLADEPRGKPLVWVAYLVSSVLALGTHYYAIMAHLAQGAWMIGQLSRSGRRVPAWRALRAWLLAQVAVAAAMLPWVVLTFTTATEGALGLKMERASWDLLTYLKEIAFTLSAGPDSQAWMAATALLPMALAAAWALWRDFRRETARLAVLVAVPVAAAFLVQLRVRFFAPRFLLYLLPMACLLMAVGLVKARRIGVMLGLLLLLSWGMALPAAQGPSVGADEDLRPLAAELERLSEPGDGIIVGYVWQEGILEVYAPQAEGEYLLGWFDRETLGTEIAALFGAHPRLWLLTYRVPIAHPASLPGWWLETHATRAFRQQHDAHDLGLYYPGCGESSVAVQTAAFDQGIWLSYRPVDARMGAGQFLMVDLSWRVEDAPREPFSVFVHLLDAQGELRAQHDSAPQNGHKPFSSLAPLQSVPDCRALFLPRDIPPGEYAVRVGVYDTRSGERLRLAKNGDDGLVLGKLAVLPPDR